jgi:hypothetical protein
MPDPLWGQESEDQGEEGETPENPRLWFLRDPAAMARRLVLAEILGAPRSRAQRPRPPVTTSDTSKPGETPNPPPQPATGKRG